MSKERRERRRQSIQTALKWMRDKIHDSTIVKFLAGLEESDLSAVRAIKAYCEQMISDGRVSLDELVVLGALIHDLAEQKKDEKEALDG